MNFSFTGSNRSSKSQSFIRIKKHRKWKTKNPKLVAKDKAYRTVINEFKSGRIDHDEYMRKIVKLNSKKSDIPKTRRAVLRLLEDSDTE